MRLFIAIKLKERTRELLSNKVNLLKSEIDEDLKWVKPINWHLTLKFLGETDERKVKIINESISNLVNDWQQITLQFKGIAAFPHLNFPKILILHVDQGEKKLIKLQGQLDKLLEKNGFTPESRTYTPHLTLARSKRKTNINNLARLIKPFLEPDFINLYMTVDKISLIRSILKPRGPVYEEIFSANLMD